MSFWKRNLRASARLHNFPFVVNRGGILDDYQREAQGMT
jgi:hypothetical protein